MVYFCRYIYIYIYIYIKISFKNAYKRTICEASFMYFLQVKCYWNLQT